MKVHTTVVNLHGCYEVFKSDASMARNLSVSKNTWRSHCIVGQMFVGRKEHLVTIKL